MNRTTLLIACALLGSLLLVAGPGAADDVEECGTAEAPDGAASAEACVKDTTEGDRGIGSDDCSNYRGFTGATASADGGDAGAYDAEAGGEEECETSAWSGIEDRDNRTYATVSPSGGPLGFASYSEATLEWSDSGITTFVFLPSDYGFLYANPGVESYFTGCQAGGFIAYQSAGTGGGVFFYQGCGEEGPPGPPNPGWGNVVP